MADDQPDIHPAKPIKRDIFICGLIGSLAFLIAAIFNAIPPTQIMLGIALIIGAIALYSTWRTRRGNLVIAPDLLDGGSVYQIAANLIDSLPRAAAIIDKRHKVVHANAMARDLFHVEVTGKSLAATLGDPEINNRLEQALAGHNPDPLMLHIEDSHEQYIRLFFSTSKDFGPTDPISLTFVMFDDVTDANVEQERRADFLANASHELKTPIASLMGYIETLRGHAKDDPDAQERFLGIMQSQAERMQRLIDDLLSLRKLEQQAHIAPEQVADLRLAIRGALEVVDPLAVKRNVKVKYKSLNPEAALVRGKQDECLQLCLNLIENAVKISEPGGKVTVKLRKLEQCSSVRAFDDSSLPDDATSRRIVHVAPSSDPCWLITISDTGPGFARTHIARVGERFYRIAGDLSSKEKGTGLGLAIVKHIVKRHRGGFYIRSQQWVGTDFSILLMAEESSELETNTV